MKKIKVLALVGPTGVGKTGVAVLLARNLKAEIVSADSMQIYRGLDIGTDKACVLLRSEVPHHLIDVADITEDFNVSRFQQMARTAIIDISQRGKLPLVVGGSGLYVRAALDAFHFPPGELGTEKRTELNEIGDRDPGLLWEQLRKADPAAAGKIPPGNTRRVIRALEMIEGGRLYSDQSRDWNDRKSVYETLFIGLNLDRVILYDRIERRVDLMIDSGLEEEVKRLMNEGLESSTTARQALGYKEFIAHFRGESSLEDTISLIKRRTRQLAKRQMTWFKADPRINWIDADNKSVKDLADEVTGLVSAAGFIVR